MSGLTERAFEIIVVIILNSDLTSRNSFKLGVAYPSFTLFTHYSTSKHIIIPEKGFPFFLLCTYVGNLLRQRNSQFSDKTGIIILYLVNGKRILLTLFHLQGVQKGNRTHYDMKCQCIHSIELSTNRVIKISRTPIESDISRFHFFYW